MLTAETLAEARFGSAPAAPGGPTHEFKLRRYGTNNSRTVPRTSRRVRMAVEDGRVAITGTMFDRETWRAYLRRILRVYLAIVLSVSFALVAALLLLSRSEVPVPALAVMLSVWFIVFVSAGVWLANARLRGPKGGRLARIEFPITAIRELRLKHNWSWFPLGGWLLVLILGKRVLVMKAPFDPEDPTAQPKQARWLIKPSQGRALVRAIETSAAPAPAFLPATVGAFPPPVAQVVQPASSPTVDGGRTTRAEAPPPYPLGPPAVQPEPVPPVVERPRPETAPSRLPAPMPHERKARNWKVIVAIAASVALIGGVVTTVAVIGGRGTKTNVALPPKPRVSVPAALGAVAVPTSLHVEKATNDSLTLAWAPPPGGRVHFYWIYRDGRVVGTLPATVLEFQDSGLTPATTYRYRVAAEADGHLSPQSPDVIATTATPELTNARLRGTYEVQSTVTSVSGTPLRKDGLTVKEGDRYTEFWKVLPRSYAEGPLGPEHGTSRFWVANGETRIGDPWALMVYQEGSVYSGDRTESLFSCQGSSDGTISLSLSVVKGQMIRGSWRAVRWEGTFTEHTFACSAVVVARIVGTRVP